MIFSGKIKQNIFLYLVGLLILFFLPLASMNTQVFGVRTSIPNIFTYLFVFSLILKMLFNNKIPTSLISASNIRYVGTMSCLMLLLTLTDDSPNSIRVFITFLGAIIAYLVGIYISSDFKKKNYWEIVAFTAVACACVVGISHYFDLLPLFEFEKQGALARELGDFAFENRGATGLINTRGDYGIWCTFGLAIVARWWLKNEGLTYKIVAIVGAAIILYAMFISQSRSTWVAGTVFLIVVLFGVRIVKEKRPKLREYTLIMYMLISILLLSLSYTVILEIFDMILNIEVRSVYHRGHGNKLGLESLSNYPFFGTGIGKESIQNKYGYHIHNSLLYISSVRGLFVGGLFLVFLLVLLRDVMISAINNKVYRYRVYLLIWFAALLGIIVEMMLYNGSSSKYFWFIVGAIRGEVTLMVRGDS